MGFSPATEVAPDATTHKRAVFTEKYAQQAKHLHFQSHKEM